ncbi:MAG TPA: alkaline phosphatase family protein, partial [Patescibacteria group bacterium]|nr:alkaline phosphatase family protein [Patescibacteria group bacterium]
LKDECISIFPSITPAATASIITGTYPQEHGIIGAYWYDSETKDIAYFGDDVWVILKHGIGEFFEDFLIKLNHRRLGKETLFEKAEDNGLKAACINFFIYHGRHEHEVHTPFLLGMLPGVPFTEKVLGPEILCLGDFVSTELHNVEAPLETDGGVFKRFGFEDSCTADVLKKLGETKMLPDFTLAYFPDNDHKSHDVGAENALEAVIKVDEYLGSFAETFGGIDKMLEEVCVIITGDHSQSDIVNEDNAGILLDDILKEFSVASPGKKWEKGEQIMVCPNLRVAQLYFRDATHNLIEQVMSCLLAEERIDQVLWRSSLFKKNAPGWHIATRDRGTLYFWVGNDGENTARDAYGCSWSWVGNLETVDARVENGTLIFKNYPNAFERIAGGLQCENSGDLWVTAHLGHECSVTDTAVHHGGGSHGSLHVLDSVAPLIIAGAPEDANIPNNPRIVDLAGIILSILGLDTPHRTDASHISL